jgi:hypothetical protein
VGEAFAGFDVIGSRSFQTVDLIHQQRQAAAGQSRRGPHPFGGEGGGAFGMAPSSASQSRLMPFSSSYSPQAWPPEGGKHAGTDPLPKAAVRR